VRTIILSLALLFICPPVARVAAQNRTVPSQARSGSEYVGAKVCGDCHGAIYRSFLRTDMGRSMSAATPGIPAGLPASTSFFDAQLNRHFSVSIRDGQIYESEWETDANGHDTFRQTESVEWLIGAGANGIGALVRRGNSVFEAPLTYYTKTGSWALSPGYEGSDRGFTRPIDASCISCHSGRPNPVENSPGQFRVPLFDELAIGCENCHGPGAAHVQQMRQTSPAARHVSPQIVNPGQAFAVARRQHLHVLSPDRRCSRPAAGQNF
jgi:hypothetical protein